MIKLRLIRLLGSCLLLALTMMIDAQGMSAQVTVNAPSGILNRTGKKDNAKDKSKEKTKEKPQRQNNNNIKSSTDNKSDQKTDKKLDNNPKTVAHPPVTGDQPTNPKRSEAGLPNESIPENRHMGQPHGQESRGKRPISQADKERYRMSNQRIEKKVTGYRVQIVFSSAKDARNTCYQRAKEVAYKFPHYRTYVSYYAPQWRLRLGDFKKREHARRAMQKLRRAFPKYASEMIIVTDKINVWESMMVTNN